MTANEALERLYYMSISSTVSMSPAEVGEIYAALKGAWAHLPPQSNVAGPNTLMEFKMNGKGH